MVYSHEHDDPTQLRAHYNALVVPPSVTISGLQASISPQALRGPCTLTLLQPVFPLFSFFFDLTHIILYHSSPEHQNKSHKIYVPLIIDIFRYPLTLCGTDLPLSTAIEAPWSKDWSRFMDRPSQNRFVPDSPSLWQIESQLFFFLAHR